MLALYTSDLHGEPDLYRQLYALLDAHRPDLVLLGGDICPTRFGPDGPPLQRKFLETLLERFDEYGARGVRFYFIFGNADCRANWDWLASQERPHAVPVHGRVVDVGEGISIAGYSCVPITPLALKDWEKRDLADTGGEQWQGLITFDGGVRRVDLRDAGPHESLEADFEALASRLEGRRPICLFHSPPSNTRLDCIGPGRHVGSHAAREFILRVKPPLALHGHIHESPHHSGAYFDYLEGSLCVNPGQSLGGELHAVLFDPRDPGNTMRHNRFSTGAPPGGRP